MLIPRRVRRRLLLPPGWVALGLLLWLGCQALRPWQRHLRQWNVIQLTMLALHPNESLLWDKIVYQSPWQLNRLRPWRTIEFQGRKSSDSLSANVAQSAIQKIIADNRHASGVRIRFLPGATYANLVKVLDIMHDTGQRKYWLDIRHQPVTLYAVTDGNVAIAKSTVISLLGCLLCDDVMRSNPTPVAQTVQQLIAEFRQEASSLRERVWRQPLLLLLVISSLSLGRFLLRKQRYSNS